MATSLASTEGWNQVEADWRLFLRVSPEGCFVAETEGRAVGTATTVNYQDRVAWIGMILVSREYRRRGIATALMNASLDCLSSCRSVKLDATPAGKKVYMPLGFVDECGLGRYELGKAPSTLPVRAGLRPMRESDVGQAAALDASAFGASRVGVISGLLSREGSQAAVVECGGQVVGLAMGRAGKRAFQLGPVVASEADMARDLVLAVLCRLHKAPVFMDVLDRNQHFLELLREIGFSLQRPFVRMYVGAHVGGDLSRYFALMGPELG